MISLQWRVSSRRHEEKSCGLFDSEAEKPKAHAQRAAMGEQKKSLAETPHMYFDFKYNVYRSSVHSRKEEHQISTPKGCGYDIGGIKKNENAITEV